MKQAICRVFGFLGMIVLLAGVTLGQTDSFTRNFKKFPQIAPGVDFYAADRAHVAAYEKPVQEAQARMVEFLGAGLAAGAIVICSSLEQKDTVSEARMLKMGYKWVLIQLTPEAAREQVMARMKSQIGNELTVEIQKRTKRGSQNSKGGSAAPTVIPTIQRMAYAILSTTLAPEKPFRASRLDDLGRSPLVDWLDVGLASYATGSSGYNLRYLQQHLDEAFPLEDVITIPRPFVLAAAAGGAGEGQIMMRVERASGGDPGGSPGAGFAGGGGSRSGGSSVLTKDVQDRMLFDGQAESLFTYLIEKVGLDKTRQLVARNRDGKEVRSVLLGSEYLGSDLDKIESDFQAWVKAQKTAAPEFIRVRKGPGKSGAASP